MSGPPQPSRRRVLTRLGVGAAALMGSLILLSLAGVAFLRSDAGLEWLRTVIERVASVEDRRLRIAALEGAFPEHLRVVDLTLADADGTLITVSTAEIRWRPLDLLRRRLTIDALALETVAIERLAATPSDAPADGFRPPGVLPLDVTLGSFAIETVRVGPAVLGTPFTLTASAGLLWRRNGEARIDLAVAHQDPEDGRLTLSADHDPAGARLRVALYAGERSGGLAATLLDLPGRPPVRMTFAGDGTLDDWAGRVKVAADGLAALEGYVTLEGRRPTVARTSVHVDVDRALGEAARPLLAGGVGLEANAEIAPERITLTALRVETAAGRLTADGRYDRAADALDAAAHVRLGPATAFQGLLPGLSYRDGGADVALSGPLSWPTARLTASASDLSLDGIGAATLAIEGSLAPRSAGGAAEPFSADYALALAIDGLRTADAALDRVVAEGVRLNAGGWLDARRLTVDRLALAAGPAEISGHGAVALADPAFGEATLDIALADLRSLTDVLGTPIAGAAAAKVTVSMTAEDGVRATLSGAAEPFSIASPALDALVGRRLVLDAGLVGGEDTPWRIDATLVGEGFQAIAAATLAADVSGLADAHLRVSVPDLQPLRTALPDLDGGSATLSVSAHGPFDALTGTARVDGRDVRLAQVRLDRVSALIEATSRPAARGTFTIDASGTPGVITLSGPFAVEGNDALRLPALVLTYEGVLRADADLSLPLDGAPIVGTIAAAADTLAPIGERWGVAGDGGLRATATLDADAGRQRLRGELTTTALRYGPAPAPTLSAERVAVVFSVIDPATPGRVEVRAEAVGIDGAEGRFERTTVDVDGSGDTYAVRAATTSDGHVLRRLATSAEVRLGDGERMVAVIHSLDGDLAGETFHLARPARVSVGGETLSIADVVLLYGAGRAELTLDLSPRAADGHLIVRDLDLGLVERFAPDTVLDGRLGVDARLSGTPASPRLDLDIAANDVRGGRRTAPGARTPPIDATLRTTATAGRAASQLAIERLGDEPLLARLDLPLLFSLAPFRLRVVDDGPLAGDIHWRGAIGQPFRLLPIDAFIVDGQTDVDLAIAGTPARPAINGRLIVADGRIEVFETGTILSPLRAEVAFADRTLRVVDLNAGDGARGRIEGGGTFTWGGAPVADLSLAVRDATLIRRDDVTARMSGSVDFRGIVGERALLVAALTNEATEIRLVDRLPPSIPTIDVVFAEDLEKQAAPPPVETETATGWLRLDARIDAPGRIFVRGRGVDSEWKGHARAEGPIDAPNVHGQIEPVRGEVSLLGRRFVIQSGSIVINGLDQDPRLNLTAAFARRDFQALVHVAGTTAAPKVTMASVPELPEDEVLSRVLFDKGSGRLTTGEALQMAAAARTLASGEPGVLDRVRDLAGLDRLAIGGGDEAETIGTVEAGRYLAPGVYAGVEQGATAGFTAFVVEVDLTSSIKARSANSSDGLHRFGVRWSIDY